MIDTNNFECEHPKLIVNRTAINYIAFGMPFFAFGRRYQKTFVFSEDYIRWNILNEWLYTLYDPISGDIDMYNANRCYVQLPDGKTEDIFMLVKCGNCLLCSYARVRRYSSRLFLESEQHIYPPLFITLTYRDAPPEPLKRDCQLFIKRLRANVSKDYPDVKLRYFLVAERGTENNRIHYHLLLYGLPFNMLDNNEAMLCYQYISFAWSFDRRKFKTFKTDLYHPKNASKFTIQHKNSIGLVEVKPTDGRKALYNYIGKYMFKKDLFRLSSSGLGLKLPYSELRKSFLHNPSDSLSFRGSSNLFRLSADSTILNKIAPSYGRCFDAQFKRKLQYAGNVLRQLAKYGPSFQLSDYQKKFFEYKYYFEKQGIILKLDFNIYKYGHKKLRNCVRYVPNGYGNEPYVQVFDDTILNSFSYLDDVLKDCEKHKELFDSFNYPLPMIFHARQLFFDRMKSKSKDVKLIFAKNNFARIKKSLIFAGV